MPLIDQIQIQNATIGFWQASESEASLKAGITLSPLTARKLSKVKSEHRRIEILATRRLMHRMGIADTNLHYERSGKPMLKSGHFISISHSSGVICVALSEDPIGIDIQKRSYKLTRIIKWFVHSKEEKDVKNNNILRLSLIWSAKEALYKLMGINGLSLSDFHVKIPKMIDEKGSFNGGIAKGSHLEDFTLHYGHRDKYIWVLAQTNH